MAFRVPAQPNPAQYGPVQYGPARHDPAQHGSAHARPVRPAPVAVRTVDRPSDSRSAAESESFAETLRQFTSAAAPTYDADPALFACMNRLPARHYQRMARDALSDDADGALLDGLPNLCFGLRHLPPVQREQLLRRALTTEDPRRAQGLAQLCAGLSGLPPE